MVAKLCQECCVLEQVRQLAQSFIALVHGQTDPDLSSWQERVYAHGLTHLTTFARGLDRDRKAVEAAFRQPWSQGQVEGQVHRLKLIKRQMYGRASFVLLRKRVLLTA